MAKKRFDVTLYIPVTRVMHNWLRDYAESNGKTITELVRSAIEGTYDVPNQWGFSGAKSVGERGEKSPPPDDNVDDDYFNDFDDNGKDDLDGDEENGDDDL